MKNVTFGFVFYSPKHKKFVGVDQNSGGYVYFSDFLGNAEIWSDKLVAEDYKNVWVREGNKTYGYDAENWVLINLTPVKNDLLSL